ncbi:MAG: hypothetical protein K9G65_05840 [Rickettsiaceae bacterium]|nr:hypothetical protein [Rickettsiaceae bacterium]
MSGRSSYDERFVVTARRRLASSIRAAASAEADLPPFPFFSPSEGAEEAGRALALASKASAWAQRWQNLPKPR